MLNLPRWGVFLLDLAIIIFSIGLAYLVRFNFHIPSIEYKLIEIAGPLIFVIRVISFLIFRTYAGILVYTSLEDAKRIFWAITGGSFIFLLITPFATHFVDYHVIPYSIIVIDYLITMFSMLSYRVFVKIFFLELRNQTKEKRKVIIYGAGTMGVTTKQALDRDMGVNYSVLAFVDDDTKLKRKQLQGIDIYDSSFLKRLLVNNQPDMLILSTPNIPSEKKQEIIELCLQENVKVLSVPPMEKWINGELSFKQIREIAIEELLEREPIQLDVANIERQLRNKIVLVTGAAGSIGSEIARQVMHFEPKKLLLLDQAETPLHELDLELRAWKKTSPYEVVIGDIRDENRLRLIFEKWKPNIVFHAAAYKHVPMMEHHPAEAIKTNVLGTRSLANLAVVYKTSYFVLVSTDKAVNPTNIMGASKRIAEMYIQSFDQKLKKENGKTRFITTRFGNVLGSNGSVIPLFKKQISSGGPVTVTHPEMTRFFMTIPEACQLVLEAGAMGSGGEIFVFDMGRAIRILDLAKKMITLSGLEIGKDIHIVFSGLRPGEKLYEEVLNSAESSLPTHHKKILIAKVRPVSYQEIDLEIEALRCLLSDNDNHALVKKMKAIVPEFKSNNSVFEDLDREKNY